MELGDDTLHSLLLKMLWDSQDESYRVMSYEKTYKRQVIVNLEEMVE